MSTPANTAPIHGGIWDRIGIGLSGLCVLHCLLIPVAIATIPLWSTTLHAHELVHPLFAALLIPVTFQAVRGARRQYPGASRIPMLLVGGLLVVLLAFGLHDPIGEMAEAVLTSAGSGLLISGHVSNWRMRSREGSACRIPFNAGEL